MTNVQPFYFGASIFPIVCIVVYKHEAILIACKLI